jgi:tRNA threonylcarbamoyl adenosine modification protein (Sua5/YciO/YrdC/YwlC family)
MKLKVFGKSPAPRHIEQIVNTLKNNGVAILPTDSVYCFAVSSQNPAAIAKLAQLKGLDPEKARFSLMLSDISSLGLYTKHLGNNVYKWMNKLLPGPFTFILPASNYLAPRKKIGIRIPNHKIPTEVIKYLEAPLLTSSVYDNDEHNVYNADPDIIANQYLNTVDLIVDGGYANNEASTIIDCSNGELIIKRKGIGNSFGLPDEEE